MYTNHIELYIYTYTYIYILCCIHDLFRFSATSGLPAAPSQLRQVEDSVQLFTSDTLKGGAKKPELVKVLCGNSGPDVARRQDGELRMCSCMISLYIYDVYIYIYLCMYNLET